MVIIPNGSFDGIEGVDETAEQEGTKLPPFDENGATPDEPTGTEGVTGDQRNE